MMDAGVSFIWPDGMWNRTLLGDGVDHMPQFLSYLKPTKTADGYVTCAALSDQEWASVCDGIRRPEMAKDPRFLTLIDRLENWSDIMELLNAECADLSTEELCARMDEADAPFAKVTELDDLHDDPQIKSQNTIVEADHPQGGPLRMPSPVARFQSTPSDIRAQSPMLGEHTDQVLAEIGHDAEKIASLRAAGIVG